ncbi:MAG TPA: hypothetical protein VM753_21065 [Anaeromyxobacter sp.]|nr:hypothetical protein [Anaeromyxobacter sp.]
MHTRALVLSVTLAVACARPSPAGAKTPEAPARWGPYAVDLVDGAGAPLPTFEHKGRTFVLGALGARYAVRVRNGSGERVEVVVSVDGRDVVDGRPSRLEKHGYILQPYGSIAIDGFRLSDAAVAAFRFASVPRSYAARMGDARDVGVIGVAIFPERAPELAYDAERLRGADAAPSPRAGAQPGAPAASAAPERRAERRGLGTEFGEERTSPVERVSFERARPRPDAVLTLRYDDRPGLLALGIPVDGLRPARDDAWLRRTADPFRRDTAYAAPPPGWTGR